MSEPAWHPDPTGRNQYRWWDGAAWTESVSNNGVVGADSLQAAAPQATTQATPQATPRSHATVFEPAVPQTPQVHGAPPVTPAAGATPGFATPAPNPLGGPGFTPGAGSTDLPFAPAAGAKKSSPLKWIIPVVVVLAVGAGLFFVLGGDDDGGGGATFGAVDGELETDESIVSYEYRLSRGDALRIRVEPSRRLDTEVLVLVDGDTAAAYGDSLVEIFDDEDLFSDAEDFFTDAEDLFSDSDLGDLGSLILLQSFDNGVDGQPDSDWFVALADGTYTVAVKSWDDASNGEFRIIAERFEDEVDIDGFDGFSEFDEFFSDEDFFTDDSFFSDEDPFEP